MAGVYARLIVFLVGDSVRLCLSSRGVKGEALMPGAGARTLPFQSWGWLERFLSASAPGGGSERPCGLVDVCSLRYGGSLG